MAFGRGSRREQRAVTNLAGAAFAVASDSSSATDPMALAAVWAAVRIIADGLTAHPVEAVGRDGAVVPGLPMLSGGLGGTQIDWVGRVATSLLLSGNAYGWVVRGTGKAVPDAIEWLDPGTVHLEKDATSVVPAWSVSGVQVPPERILHVANIVSPGRRLGLSPLGALRRSVQSGIHAEQHGVDWFAGQASPSGILTTPAGRPSSKEQASAIKSSWRTASRGRGLVVVPHGFQYEAVSLPAEDGQFLATIRASATQVASIFGVPPEEIGGDSGSSMTYGTVELNELRLINRALRPMARRIEAALDSTVLDRSVKIRFNLSQADFVDSKTTAETSSVLVRAGILTVNEGRARQGLPPVVGGEEAVPETVRQANVYAAASATAQGQQANGAGA